MTHDGPFLQRIVKAAVEIASPAIEQFCDALERLPTGFGQAELAALVDFFAQPEVRAALTFCSAHASLMRWRRLGPMPSTSSSRADSCSMMSKMRSPNVATSFLAYIGPMPLTIPLPRYFSMPSLVLGAVLLSMSARNCRPNSLSWTQRPSAVTHSPALTEAREPTTATKSRCPLAFTLSTAQPFSSLKKVTRSISPERLSWGRADGGSVRNGSDCGCTASGWQGVLAPGSRLSENRNCAQAPTRSEERRVGKEGR